MWGKQGEVGFGLIDFNIKTKASTHIDLKLLFLRHKFQKNYFKEYFKCKPTVSYLISKVFKLSKYVVDNLRFLSPD